MELSNGRIGMEFFDTWKESLKWQRIKSYEKFAQMIEKHWDGVAAYSKPQNKVSLGFLEGLNNKIRVIQGEPMDHGMRNILSSKYLLACLRKHKKCSKLPTRLLEEPSYIIPDGNYFISDCSIKGDTYFSLMRKKIIFQRDIKDCISNNKYILYNSNTNIPSGENIVYKDKYFRLTTYNERLNSSHIKERLMAQSGIYTSVPQSLENVSMLQGEYGYLNDVNGYTNNNIIVDRNSIISGSGWIINLIEQPEPDSVYVVLKRDSIPEYLVATNLSTRQDVGMAKGQKYINSEYEFRVQKNTFLTGEYDIGVISIAKHKAFKMDTGKSIFMK